MITSIALAISGIFLSVLFALVMVGIAGLIAALLSFGNEIGFYCIFTLALIVQIGICDGVHDYTTKHNTHQACAAKTGGAA